MRKKVHEFYFRLDIDLHCYFNATCALLDDYEFFDNFGHIFTSLLSHGRLLQVDMSSLGMNFQYKYLTNQTQLKTMGLATRFDSIYGV